MKLWKLSQTVNKGYDVYDSCVVAAKDILEARSIHPSGYYPPEEEWWKDSHKFYDWAHVCDIKVSYLGEAHDKTFTGVICASFNAG
jgi:hypothetical protein